MSESHVPGDENLFRYTSEVDASLPRPCWLEERVRWMTVRTRVLRVPSSRCFCS